MNAKTKKDVRTRLGRIRGQIEGLQRMVEEDRYCVDILLQVAAAKAALERVGHIVLSSHVDTCVADALASGSEREARRKATELMEVLSKFAQIRTH